MKKTIENIQEGIDSVFNVCGNIQNLKDIIEEVKQVIHVNRYTQVKLNNAEGVSYQVSFCYKTKGILRVSKRDKYDYGFTLSHNMLLSNEKKAREYSFLGAMLHCVFMIGIYVPIVFEIHVDNVK